MEIKPQELRVGNLLSFLGKEVEVECISNNIVRKDMYWVKPKGMIESKIFHFKPIQITEEWLIKFDFYKWGNEYSLADGFFYISFKFYKNGNKKLCINGDSKKYIKGKDMFINYVHQLQNLYLALTNEELEIK